MIHRLILVGTLLLLGACGGGGGGGGATSPAVDQSDPLVWGQGNWDDADWQ